jgi:dolichol kinase
MKISSVSVKLTLTGFLAGVVAFFFLVVFDAIFCFFLGGMVMLSAKETTLADCLREMIDFIV